ncbi:PEP/pyruvate-binding domain-containing protein [Pelagicoccus sp. SDUM812003]|uniref:PEP/pyruvate-binding domain-containing protein n=1 Tax=Pelagicoccus sp. SDUM812003 TaxID=3041267 RepID=UPI00280C70F5|nr:PEP/pyruvate-binding domain-containing protein [Pelagicoccus sp. SDUM812003]MDQ8205072.1 PEP/pyruvate-binding domain-containing protein [Pelagicoccus sp. SDUM812003]
MPPVVPADDSLDTRLTLPGDALFSEPFEQGDRTVTFAKFTILMDDLTTVYFQDTKEYAFHYEFAVDKIPMFAGMTRSEFDEVTLALRKDERDRRQAVLGSVILDEENGHYYIEFEGSGFESPRFVALLYHLVDTSLEAPGTFVGFLNQGGNLYFSAVDLEYLDGEGIAFSSNDAWGAEDNVCYVKGWTLGRLNFVRSEDVLAAYENGELLSTDILITDTVPGEVPYVSGIVTLEPATPNSHVAILARAYDIPFLYAGDVEFENRLLSLIDQEVLVWTGKFCEWEVHRVDDLNMDAETLAYFKGLKTAAPLDFEKKRSYGSYSENVIGLTPDDIASFGGKAANFGFLLREIPENTRPYAVAFSMDLWDDYMAQEIEAGLDLGSWIEDTLSGYTWANLDLPSLNADLKKVRDTIEDVADFSPSQRAEVLAALDEFDEMRRIRFRSSTNVEDAENYSGAGLYDSKSGCLADELDGDDSGPSICEPDEEKERGVFRAMRKVYASFYNENAFMERLRLGVDESKVGMGVLAHYSYPDESEMANGVLVYDESEWPWERLKIVSQVGAESVANPEPGSAPEVVYAWGDSVDRDQSSGLVDNQDDWVLGNQERYLELAELVRKVVSAYRAFHDDIPENEEIALDLEYKLVSPGVLEIKQVRRVPTYNASTEKVAYIGGDREVNFITNEGSLDTALGFHYIKSAFEFQERSARIDTLDAKQTPLIESMRWTRVKDGEVVTYEGDPLDLPNASFIYEEGNGIYRWSEESDGETNVYTLTHLSNAAGTSDQGGLIPRSWSSYFLSVTFEQPRFAGHERINGELAPMYRDEFSSYGREPSPQVLWDYAVRDRFEVSDEESVSVLIDYWRESQYTADFIIKTGHLLRWNKTEVRGLLADPIEFTTDFSRTQSQGHHNFWATFVFDPWLEPSVSQDSLEELEAIDVRLILSGHTGLIGYVGLDGSFREEL